MKIKKTSELERAIRDRLDEDLCVAVVNLGFSETGDFEDEVFIDSDTFFDTIVNTESYKVALMFFKGRDLDRRGQANPTREYFRLDSSDNVESTDDPGAIYYDTLLDDIVDYIIDHIADLEFPEDIQEIVDEYLNNTED